MSLPHAALSSAVTSRELNTYNSGILVLDANSRAVSWNYEFLQIMSYPKSPSRLTDLHSLVAGYVRNLVRSNNLPGPLTPTELVSGRRRYRCRAFALSHGPRHLVIMLDRSRLAVPPLALLSQQYALTTREGQVLQCVLEGLSNKEAAHRLKISHNTVKVFVRLVMMKMGVSSRSAILSRILSFPTAA